MASRELNILVTAKNMASRVLGDVRHDVGSLQGTARKAAVNTTRNVGIASVAAAGIVATQVRAGLQTLAELDHLNRQTEAVLKSTRGAAGVTKDEVRSLAEEMENLTTVDDKAVQNAENIELTFTKINKKAFRPVLETVLDMNAALGGDENSLQGVMIQVGKALQDPVRGLTALRRVGVNFNDQQQERIKNLVKEGDLEKAQAVILKELNKEFGGSAKAFGQGPAADLRRFQDAVEDVQASLATAFLPVLQKVGGKLETFLRDPDTLKGISDFGQTLADGFDDALQIVEKIPWDAVGSTFSLMGQGSKVVLDMFTKLPPWVQTAVLTGWGLNKITGGALGDLGKIAFDAFKGRGSTPVNPLFVTPVGGSLGGGPGGGLPAGGAPAGGLGLGAPGLGTLGAGIALPFLMFNVIPELFKGKGNVPQSAQRTIGVDANGKPITVKLDPTTTAMFQGMMPSFNKSVRDAGGEIVDASTKSSRVIDDSVDSAKALLGQRLNDVRQEEIRAGQKALETKLATDRGFATANAALRDVNSNVAKVAAKDFSPNVSVTAQFLGQFNISASAVASKVTILSNATRVAHGGSELLQA